MTPARDQRAPPERADESPEPVVVRARRLEHGQHLELPTRASSGSAGYDLRAAVDSRVVLEPGQRAIVPTGLAIELPEGYEGQVRARSGLAIKHGVAVLNAPGTIDSDYRGEVGVILVNLGSEPFEITPGMRIAQLVVAQVSTIQWRVTTAIDETDRGSGGFGSSGP